MRLQPLFHINHIWWQSIDNRILTPRMLCRCVELPPGCCMHMKEARSPLKTLYPLPPPHTLPPQHHRDDLTLSVLADKVCERVVEFKPQELANLIWAFGSLEHRNPAMVSAVAARVMVIIKLFKEQELSNLIWAFAKLHYYDPALFDALLHETKDKLHAFLPQGISNVAWALAIVGHQDDDLMDRVVLQCGQQAANFDVQALSNLIWSMASLGYRHTPFLKALTDEALLRIDRLSPQNLSNVLWGCATLNYRDNRSVVGGRGVGGEPWTAGRVGRAREEGGEKVRDIFNYAGKVSLPHCFSNSFRSGLQPPSLSAPLFSKPPCGLFNFTVFSALVTLHTPRPSVASALLYHPHPHPPACRMLSAWSRQTLAKLQGFEPQGLANTAWAFSQLGHAEPALYDALASAICSKLDGFTGSGLATVCHSFAAAGQQQPQLCDCIAAHVRVHIDSLSAQNCAVIAWSFASLRHHVPGLLDLVLHKMGPQLGACDPLNVSNLLWALARVGHDAAKVPPYSHMLLQVRLHLTHLPDPLPCLPATPLCLSASPPALVCLHAHFSMLRCDLCISYCLCNMYTVLPVYLVLPCVLCYPGGRAAPP